MDPKIKQALKSVEKPGRYCGGEYNSVVKTTDGVDIRFAFAFPDAYEVGMSHIGMKILYNIINARKDSYCERVFAPYGDMEQRMREDGIELFSLETATGLKAFDIIGFTLQYELCYTNVLNMLDLSGVPLRTAERREGPFVIAGGPCCCNPEPLWEFIDIFVLGDGEEIINDILDEYIKWKRSDEPREGFLKRVSKLKGAYVPSLVFPQMEGSVITGFKDGGGKDVKIEKTFVKDLDAALYPESFIVPYVDIVHDRISLEIMRGCTRGCRFCQAGYIYRPLRERNVQTLKDCAIRLVDSTGYDEVSLASLSSGDYSGLRELITELRDELEEKRVSLALPSLRIDSYGRDHIKETTTVRKSSLTFAPEAGTQRLRDVINKNVEENDLLESVGQAFEAGWNSVKLYFMIGLPTETMEDLDGIVALVEAVAARYYAIPKDKRAKGLRISVSTSSFVPKPHTPFQWEGQNTMNTLIGKQRYLKECFRQRYVDYSWHDVKSSMLEAVFAKGGRELSQIIFRAFEKGCKFDGWKEYFDFDKWLEAFAEFGMDAQEIAAGETPENRLLPYAHISYGIDTDFLRSERARSREGKTIEDCRKGCRACGLQNSGCSLCV